MEIGNPGGVATIFSVCSKVGVVGLQFMPNRAIPMSLGVESLCVEYQR